MKPILFFGQCDEADYPLLGGKGASLASMSKAGFPVPPGFCVTTDAYSECMHTLRAEVVERVKAMDSSNMTAFRALATEVRAFIEDQPLSEKLEQDIRQAYTDLMKSCQQDADLPVAVRSSATAEDLPEASFAGQQDTFLWVVGADSVVEYVRKCWASLYTARAIKYRKDNQIPEEEVMMSVVVQKMVNAKVAGVAMTLNPVNGDRSKIAIDSAWGLGEGVVSGEVTPDHFIMDKVIKEKVSAKIHTQKMALVPDPANKRVVKIELSPEQAAESTLTDDELRDLCELARKIEKHYGCPQDIEWALDADLPERQNLTLLQSRPETVWSQKKKEAPKTNQLQFGMHGLVNTLLNPINKTAKADR